jgi:hypothetical protein
MKIAQFVCSLLCVESTKRGFISSESRVINESRKEQEGRKQNKGPGSIDETKYVRGNILVHLSYVSYHARASARVVG